MISFPVFLVAKETSKGAEWVRVQLNEQPHLATFSTSDKATAFADSLPKDQHDDQYVIREFSAEPELSRELVGPPTVLFCVIDYVPGKGTQRAVRADLLLRYLR